MLVQQKFTSYIFLWGPILFFSAYCGQKEVLFFSQINIKKRQKVALNGHQATSNYIIWLIKANL